MGLIKGVYMNVDYSFVRRRKLSEKDLLRIIQRNSRVLLEFIDIYRENLEKLNKRL